MILADYYTRTATEWSFLIAGAVIGLYLLIKHAHRWCIHEWHKRAARQARKERDQRELKLLRHVPGDTE